MLYRQSFSPQSAFPGSALLMLKLSVAIAASISVDHACPRMALAIAATPHASAQAVSHRFEAVSLRGKPQASSPLSSRRTPVTR